MCVVSAALLGGDSSFNISMLEPQSSSPFRVTTQKHLIYCLSNRETHFPECCLRLDVCVLFVQLLQIFLYRW